MNAPEAKLGILGYMLATSVQIGDIFVPASQAEKTLHRSCKKLFIHTGDMQFPYQFFGSATALKIGNHHLLFCCGHQIDQFNPETVSFLDIGTNHTISSRRKIWPIITDKNKDADWIDVRALEYPVEKYSIPNLSSQFFPIQPRRNVWPQDAKDNFILFGYPTERQIVDYGDSPRVHGSATFVNGEYDGPSRSPHIHRLKMGRKEVFNADGMSGGPVFYVRSRGLADYFIGFAGMIMRGGATSDIIHFVEASMMLKMFDFE